ncbi:MAG: FAD-dependent oxidoreductase [Halieaceae bacterium]|jgi:dimethylglycine catabolism A|nr:FAD-dependent oxidoreductase [Halieaceae bacterium]
MTSNQPPSTRFETLFSPLQVGSMTVPNRICETTNGIGASASGGFLDERFIEHHVAKARGGAGWIGSETWILNSPLPPQAPDEFNTGVAALRYGLYQMPEFIETVGRFCDEVHKANSVAVFQLTHLNFAMAASPVPVADPYDWIPHELDDQMIEFIINTYADAAQQAKSAGADGVEIHCAHETLPHSFLSPAMNKRSDRWGGDARARIAFVAEVLERVRNRVGDSLAVGIRVNGEESRQGGYDNMEMREMTYHLGETGLLDFLNVDVGHCWGDHSYVPPSYHGHAQYRDVGKAARTDLDKSIAVLFTGRINDPVLAEELLQDGYCDLVGMTRAGIADPDFPNKAKQGRMIEIRRCIGCNRCIGDAVHSKTPDMVRRPMCSVNPVVGNELKWKAEYTPAENPQHVVVVGGGAAGLEAARIASLRGHRVTLLEQNKQLGGQLYIASRAPGRDAFEDQIYYQENQLQRQGVDVQLGARADFEAVKALRPDALIVASGSIPRVPAEVEGIDLPHVVQGWDVLQSAVTTGERVAVISQEDYFETPNVAEFLAQQGKQVEVFHKWTQVGADIDRYSISTVLGRLEQYAVKMHPNLRLRAIKPERLEFVSAHTGRHYSFDGFDSVVLVYGSTPDSSLYDEFKKDGSIEKLYLVGSAWVPRRIAEATQHGAHVAMEI